MSSKPMSVSTQTPMAVTRTGADGRPGRRAGRNAGSCRVDAPAGRRRASALIAPSGVSSRYSRVLPAKETPRTLPENGPVPELDHGRAPRQPLGPHPRPARLRLQRRPPSDELAVLPAERCSRSRRNRRRRRTRAVVDLLRRADLLDRAVQHHDDAVGQRQRLGLVVGDEDHRHAGLLLHPLQLGPHLQPQPRVEVRQRLVQQQHLRLHHHRPRQRHALLLAARQLAGLRPEKAPSPTVSSPARTRLSRSAPRIPFRRRPKATLSKTVRCGNSA